MRTFHTNPRLPLRRTRSHPIGNLRRKTRRTSEAAFALPSAIIVLFILTLLTGAAISVASQSSTSTTRDDNVKAEVEAAEAGLHVADYRLSQLKPSETQCIGEGKAETEESNCHDETESLGNGATFKYWTTLPLKAGAKCAGRTVEAIASTTQRCVTSEGKVNGVEPAVRLQTRATAGAGESLFPVKGIVGLEGISMTTSNLTANAALASNGKIKLVGTVNQKGGCELGPAGSYEHVGGGSACSPEKHRSAAEGNLVLSPVKPGNSASPSATKKCAIVSEPEGNCDFRITNGVHKFKKEAFEEPYDPLTSKGGPIINWEPAKRELSVTGEASLTLEGGVYNLCKFTSTGGFTLKANLKTEIFIDSPEDPKSKCPAGTGQFEVTGNLENAANLLILVYGKGPVNLTGSGTTNATIYAPEAPVKYTGNVNQPFSGGIAGKTVEVTGEFTFNWNEEDSSLSNGTSTAYSRKAWEQCVKGSGASEGC